MWNQDQLQRKNKKSNHKCFQEADEATSSWEVHRFYIFFFLSNSDMNLCKHCCSWKTMQVKEKTVFTLWIKGKVQHFFIFHFSENKQLHQQWHEEFHWFHSSQPIRRRKEITYWLARSSVISHWWRHRCLYWRWLPERSGTLYLGGDLPKRRRKQEQKTSSSVGGKFP